MRSFSTSMRFALAGGLLGAVALAAPASATPVTNAKWLLYQNCKQIKAGTGTGSACQSAVESGSPTGNEDQFTSQANNLNILAAAYHSTTTNGTNCNDGTKHTCTGSENGGSAINNMGKPALLGEYTGSDYGLGVENLTAPQHAMDNVAGDDFIVFEIPAGVNFNTVSITVSPFGTTQDMSFTVYYGSVKANSALATALGTTTPDPTQFHTGTTANPVALPLTDLGTSDGFTMKEFIDTGSSKNASNLYQATSPETVTFNTTGMVNYIIIAAGVKDLPAEMDYFKVNAIAVKMPEPANLAVFAAGLCGLGFAARRRKAKKA